VDVAVRRKKVVADLWESRLGVAAVVLAVGLGSLWPRLVPVDTSASWPLVLLISLVVVAQAAVPPARARAAEAPVLRALGGSDDAASRFAILEGAALGGLAGLVAVIVGPNLGQSLVWLAACVACGALCGGLVERAART
jgi:hypothetical protein